MIKNGFVLNNLNLGFSLNNDEINAFKAHKEPALHSTLP